MFIDEPTSWLLPNFSLFLVFGVHCVRDGLGLFQAQMVNSFWRLLTENVYYNNNETFKYSKGPVNNKVQCHLPATEVPQTFRFQPVRFHSANQAVMQDVTIKAAHIYVLGPAKAEQKL